MSRCQTFPRLTTDWREISFFNRRDVFVKRKNSLQIEGHKHQKRTNPTQISIDENVQLFFFLFYDEFRCSLNNLSKLLKQNQRSCLNVLVDDSKLEWNIFSSFLRSIQLKWVHRCVTTFGFSSLRTDGIRHFTEQFWEDHRNNQGVIEYVEDHCSFHYSVAQPSEIRSKSTWARETWQQFACHLIQQWIMKAVFSNDHNESIVSDLHGRTYITGWYFPCRWIGQSVGQYFRWSLARIWNRSISRFILRRWFAHIDSNEWNDWSVESFFSILDFRRIVVQSKQYTSGIWWTEWIGHAFGAEDQKYQEACIVWAWKHSFGAAMNDSAKNKNASPKSSASRIWWDFPRRSRSAPVWLSNTTRCQQHSFWTFKRADLPFRIWWSWWHLLLRETIIDTWTSKLIKLTSSILDHSQFNMDWYQRMKNWSMLFLSCTK